MIKKLYWFLFVYNLDAALGNTPVKETAPLKSRLMKDMACIVLLSHILFTFSSLVPFAADIFAHTFFEKEHLAAEHRLYGKKHVQQEISKTEKQSNNSKSCTNGKNGQDDYTHVQTVHPAFIAAGYLLINKQNPFYRVNYLITHLAKDYPPPRLLTSC